MILRGWKAWAFGALLSLGVVSPAPAGAELGAVHPDLVRAAADARVAKGPEAYAALREVWRLWDRADPAQVEEAIRAVAEDPSAAPSVQVYAKLLSSYGRRRRGDLDGAA